MSMMNDFEEDSADFPVEDKENQQSLLLEHTAQRRQIQIRQEVES